MAQATTATPDNGDNAKSSSDSRRSSGMAWLPYAIGVGAQFPLLFFYFMHLWDRGPHYHFYPLAILSVVGIAWLRWPRGEKLQFHRSLWSDVLLVIGVCAGLLATLFVEPWFAAASAMFLAASLLARTVDPETGKGMWVVSLPLFVALILPMNMDTQIITWLQRISAHFTSRLMDLVGLGHHMGGVSIQIPGKDPYGIEQACSGVMSFFTLLFVAVVFIVWNRRPWFRSFLLILSAMFWAIFMNTIRIFMIPVADNMMGVDLSHGFAHDMLGWIVLAFGILMLLSTDQFLLFLLGPVEATTGRTGPFGTFITEFWNGLVAGKAETEEEKARRKRKSKNRKPMTPFTRTLLWGMAVLLGICGVVQLLDTARSWGRRTIAVNFFSGSPETPMNRGDLTDIGRWTVQGYDSENRVKGSDLGLRSDTWNYQSPVGFGGIASFDQTFPGWHELTYCYQNQNWNLIERVRKDPSELEMTWPYIEATFEKETGERGYLLFSFFDGAGEPVDAPAQWGTLNSILIRAQNRLGERVRASLFDSKTFQCQLFVPTYGELSDAHKAEILEHYLLIRDEMRAKWKQNTEGNTAAPEAEAKANQPVVALPFQG